MVVAVEFGVRTVVGGEVIEMVLVVRVLCGGGDGVVGGSVAWSSGGETMR